MTFHTPDDVPLKSVRARSERPNWTLLPDAFCTCAEATSCQATDVCVNSISD